MQRADTVISVAYVLESHPVLSQTFVDAEIRGLVDRGVCVRVVTLYEGDRDAPGHPAPVLVCRSRLGRVLLAHLLWMGRNPAGYRRYLRLVWNHRPEARHLLFAPYVAFKTSRAAHIHTHFGLHAALVARAAQLMNGSRRSVTWHAVDIFRPLPDPRERARAASNFTISTHNAEILLRDLGIQVAAVIPCGVQTSPLRHEFRPGTIISVGRLVEKKGHDCLIRAVAVLLRRGVSVAECRILGDGPLRRDLLDLVAELGLSDIVSLVGSADHDTVLSQMRNFAVFALASRLAPDGDRDGIPVAIMEAMTAGIPVVTTALAGFEDLVSARTAYVSQPDDVESLADNLERALRGDHSQEIVAAAKQTVDSGFSVERQVDLVLDHLAVTEPRRPGSQAAARS